ncbi:serine hydrolase domain-containing protein [Streptomyces sp. NPDC004610]|uniref:serine hydrolase domain-containing protein n=1 Tax=unclassified Streptomyces TaxID=2593676 RepID=UPI0033B5E283
MTVRARATLVAATAVTLSLALAVPAFAAPSDKDQGKGQSQGQSQSQGHSATRDAMRAAVQDGVPGVTATARDTQGTWRATEGVGNLRTGAPRSADDRYRVGSITKTFVATVLLQLEAEGELDLDDTVDTWLPGLVTGNGNDGRKITVRQLLNHTSGIFNYTGDEPFAREIFLKEGFDRNRYRTWAPEELVAVAMQHEPNFTPGTSWSYSNTNYILAGMVIEAVTGRPYGEAIDDRIIEPLDLDDTFVPAGRPTLGSPHTRAYSKLAETSDGPSYDVTVFNPSAAGAAGEMVSDNNDLNRFMSALLRGKLLPPEQLKAMKTTIVAPGIPNATYGLGLIKQDLSCGTTVWGHGGGIHGSTSESYTTGDGKHSLALNLNADWTGDTQAIIEAEYCAD